MKLGIFMQPVHDPKRDFNRVLEEDRQAAILADELGYSECYIGEHITATVEPISSPITFMATLLPVTRQMKFGSGVFCLPQKHPAMVASEAALFDHLAKGRFIMGIGPGALSSDLEMFGTTDSNRGEMVVESLDMILKLWSQDPPFDFKGKYWHISLQDMSRVEFGVGRMPRPFQQPHPPIAISLMSPASPTAKLAGQQGWIPISGGSFVQSRYMASHWEMYETGCELAGRDADPDIWRVCRSIIVADSDQQAEDHVLDPDGPFAFWFNYLISSVRARGVEHVVRPDGREHDESVTWQDVARSQVAYGSPATVLDKLVAFRERTGPFGTLVQTAHEWTDPALARRSMTLLAEQVMPKLAQHSKVAGKATATV
ncbi:MAG: LLM class flavin-dependent oxidoreductase [Gammaproteobacteria bacterium]|nr:LLM class flavin-dependent oxidoreductase [Gammaproteobacteria bacterium]